MSVEIIEQNFSESERADLGEFEQRFRRVAGGKHLEDWLKMIPGLVVLSKAAMAYANANERKGRAYNEMFAALVLEHARKVSNRVSLREIEAMKPSFSYLLWLSEGYDRLAVLESELDRMPLNRRMRIASPVMAYKLVKAIEDAAAAEQKSRELGNRPGVNDVGPILAAQHEDEEPTATDGQLLAAFRRKFVNQMALLFIEADQARATDLADAIKSEIAALRRDAREAARKAGNRG
jgi:hypothetical protein